MGNLIRAMSSVGLGLAVGLWMSAAPVAAEDFYKGKTVRIVVGFAAGGGFDTYSRAIARHMGKHIPGNPTVIVDNMTGAGSLIAANYIYKAAAPDGLTIGNWIGGLVLQQVLGRKGIEFDARRLEWIGVPVRDTSVCALTKASGINNLDDWFAAKQPVKLGGEAPGATTDDVPAILQEALKLPIQLVRGYKGTSQIRLAADSGEVAGGCWAWESIKVTWRKGLETGDVKIVLQSMPKKHPDLENIPNSFEIAKTDEARTLIKAGIMDPASMVRAYSLPPGTPKERVKILRDAFMATMKDPAFLAETNKSGLDINPMSGEGVEEIAQGFFKLPPATVNRLKEVVLPKN